MPGWAQTPRSLWVVHSATVMEVQVGQSVGRRHQVDIQRLSRATCGPNITDRTVSRTCPLGVQPGSCGPHALSPSPSAECSLPTTGLLKMWPCRCWATPRSTPEQRHLRKSATTQGVGHSAAAGTGQGPRLRQCQCQSACPGSGSAHSPCQLSTPARQSLWTGTPAGTGLAGEAATVAQRTLGGRACSTGGWTGRGLWLSHSGGQV